MQKKFLDIYRFIEENLYFQRPDIEVHGRGFSSTLLFSLLTGLIEGKALIIGEPGLGKTTAAEYAASLLFGLPLGVVWAGEVSGHPEQTEEKIVGRPDLGSLNLGVEKVIFSPFARLPVKIVDEINRLPETKQSLILDGVDRGNWEYLGKVLVNEEHCLFATANFEDRATFGLIAPLKDRFDLVVESRHPGPNLAHLIGERPDKEGLLRDRELEEKIFRLFSDDAGPSGLQAPLQELSKGFKARMERYHGISLFDFTERRKARREMAALGLAEDADCFIRALVAELSFCDRFGQKRTGQTCPEDCRYHDFLCRKVKGCASNRLPGSIMRYARGLAWLFGLEEAGMEEVAAVAPFSLAHRVEWREETLAGEQSRRRDAPLIIHLAGAGVREALGRFREAAEVLMEGLARACDIIERGAGEPVYGDHPLLREIIKDLGRQDGAQRED